MVSEAREYRKRRKNGRFDGFRVNCEYVPCLPARIVNKCLSNPHRIPYLLIWKDRRWGGLKEVVRLATPYTGSDWLNSGWVELKRGDGSKVSIRLSHTANKTMLICNSCQKPRCALYGWEINEGAHNVNPAGWPCKACAGLSYASEGGALLIRRLLPELKRFSYLLRKPNPGRWEPLVFASPLAAVDSGLCSQVVRASSSRSKSKNL